MIVGLNLGYYSSRASTSRGTGHVITVWGYAYDTTKSQDDPGYYTGLFVTDSDDDGYLANAVDSPDRLNLISLSWDSGTKSYYTQYCSTKVAKLDSFSTLTHYNDWSASTTNTASASMAASQLVYGNDYAIEKSAFPSWEHRRPFFSGRVS